MTDAPVVNLHGYEARAAERLPRMVFDYFAGGAGDEVTLREARHAWDALAVRYRVLRDVAQVSLATTVLGAALDWPVLVAPMAFQALADPEGELATMRAATGTGSGLVLSTLATRPIEAVRAAGTAPLWFQLYVFKDRGLTAAMVARAEAAGATALVLTVDAPLLGRRERDLLNGFHVPPDTPIPNLAPEARRDLAAAPLAASALGEFTARHWDPSLSWRDLAWLQARTRLPILVKGVVRGDDARESLAHGAAGVIVSNHGGRQLDTAVATARALPEVADAMAGAGTLLVDGGVRRGTDVLKALALGAHAVLLGRPVLWGLAVDGAAGAARVLQLLRDETALAFALAGCRTPAEVTADLLA
ncbi:MAG: alpha-hydroxy-acid oxidizing protein [Gemmatimonadaceae bacterium]|nr:alpha-hydroxy-acid oxidizing protein [Gemmatimonadaceae bacterium]